MKKVLQFLFFAGFGVLILWLVYRSQNAAFMEQCRLDGKPEDQCNLMRTLIQDFRSASPWWLLLVMATFTVSNAFRAWRWQMLLEPLGYKTRFANGFWSIILGYFANLGLPRMGEVTRAGALARYERIPAERVMGTLVIDRLMDFICLGLVVALAFVAEGDTLWRFINEQRAAKAAASSSGGSSIWTIMLGAILLTGVLAFVFRHKIMGSSIGKKIKALLFGFQEGLRSIFQLQRPWLFVAYSLGIWLMFYLQCYFNLKAFVPTEHLTAWAALMVFVFGTLGFVIPSPGGMGTFHWLCIQALALYGIAGTQAFSYANIAFFTIQIFYNIVGGILALVILPRINRGK